ncbi:hypothetical protein PoMZ_00738 [Pyricularia oryzae]|uniref:Uncharacterized protein n=1 Tax=Pyricularia oryzae TaxID=318829 RepID=A0A4P7N6X4_PYROR|nr:hypothetical protein PoMZ_00738 [Pyricularia oryzae]
MTSCGRGRALTTSGTWYAPAIPDGAFISRLLPRKALSPVLWREYQSSICVAFVLACRHDDWLWLLELIPHIHAKGLGLTGYLPFC